MNWARDARDMGSRQRSPFNHRAGRFDNGIVNLGGSEGAAAALRKRAKCLRLARSTPLPLFISHNLLYER